MLEAAASMHDARATLGTGQLPLDFLLSVMRDEQNPLDLRIRCAAEAAPFIHPKMPQAVIVAPEAKIEGVRVEIVGVPLDLLHREFSPAQSSENGKAGTPRKYLAARTGE